jgi:hypothetical protein
MRQVGHNKLVANERLTTDYRHRRNKSADVFAKRMPSTSKYNAVYPNTYKSINQKLKRRRENHYDVFPAKRLQLQVSAAISESEELHSASLSSGTTKEGEVRLTNHAYVDTSNCQRCFGNKSWSKKDGESDPVAGKYMGLKRAAVQNEYSPICITILRGLPCTDEHCLSRHDIPKEFAIPVCSFFQKNGMCWKQDSGTCPFRHVKVDPKAQDCPMFRCFGYCEDPQCSMSHVRSHRSSGTEKLSFKK